MTHGGVNADSDRDTHRQNKPFEQNKVEVVVIFGQHIADDACRISGADLIAGEGKVDALGKIPQLGSNVVGE